MPFFNVSLDEIEAEKDKIRKQIKEDGIRKKQVKIEPQISENLEPEVYERYP